MPDSTSPSKPAPMVARKSIWTALPYIVVWMTMSMAVIFMNSAILRRMPKPAMLTAWHMGVSSVLVWVLRRVAPADLQLFGTETPAVDAGIVLRKFLPVAFLFSLSLVMGNRAYIYCSVPFIQMIKASHSAMTYLMNVSLGVESFHWSLLKLVCTVWLGVVVAVAGELRFTLFGFACQAFSSVSECARLVLIGVLLHRQGLKFDPLTALGYYAPLCFALLLPLALVTEMPEDLAAWWAELHEQVGLGVVVLNGLVAFCLNLSSVLLIKKTDAVIFILCGITKDAFILLVSVTLLSVPVSLQQYAGYAIAISGVQAFNQVMKNPAQFDEVGVVQGIKELLRGQAAGSPDTGGRKKDVNEDNGK